MEQHNFRYILHLLSSRHAPLPTLETFHISSSEIKHLYRYAPKQGLKRHHSSKLPYTTLTDLFRLFKLEIFHKRHIIDPKDICLIYERGPCRRINEPELDSLIEKGSFQNVQFIQKLSTSPNTSTLKSSFQASSI